MMQLNEVASGQLSLRALLDDANGAIDHGRILAGANTLKTPLAKAPSVPQQLALDTFNAIQIYLRRAPVSGSPTIQCPIKSLAMPLADSMLYTPGKEEDFSHSLALAFATDINKLPVYQPLHKVLFTTLLWMISPIKLPPCSAKIPIYTPPPKEDLRNAKEEQEHDDGVDE